MKRLTLLVASLSISLLLPGCLQTLTTVNVKADGSGTVVEEISFGAQMSAMLGGLGGLGGMAPGGEAAAPKDPFDEMFGEAAAKEKAAKMGEGVSVQKVDKIDKDGKKGARVTYAFKDINKLELRLDAGTDAMEGATAGIPGAEEAVADAKEKSEPIRFTFSDGELAIMMPQPDADTEGKDLEIPDVAAEMEKDPQAAAMAKAMFADMKMALKVVVEPGIKQSDASHVEGNQITLMEMNFGELMENPEGMQLLEQMQAKKPEELADVLKDLKGVKYEAKEKVTVKMK